MRPRKILHQGLQRLEIAFKGALAPDDLERLEAGLRRATRDKRPAPVKLGRTQFLMHVAATGAKGGFAFRCQCNRFEETWFFRRSPSPDNWNIRVELGRRLLIRLGLAKTHKRVLDTLRALGLSLAKECVARVDYVIDFLMPSLFSVTPDKFVAHSRCRIVETTIAPKIEQIDPNEFTVRWSGRRAIGVTIGKLPGREIELSDFYRFAAPAKRLKWHRIWNLNPELPNFSIWRLEIRLGKKHLNEFWHIRRFADLERKLPDAVLRAVTVVRYLEGGEHDPNVSRHKSHRLWQTARQAIIDDLRPRDWI